MQEKPARQHEAEGPVEAGDEKRVPVLLLRFYPFIVLDGVGANIQPAVSFGLLGEREHIGISVEDIGQQANAPDRTKMKPIPLPVCRF